MSILQKKTSSKKLSNIFAPETSVGKRKEYCVQRMALIIVVIMLGLLVLSCGPTKADDNNNTDTNNNADTKQPPLATIEITNIDNSIAQLNGDTIELKASGFPRGSITQYADIASPSFMNRAKENAFKRAFDITITINGEETNAFAEGAAGLLFVGTGNLPSANAFSVKGVNQEFGGYSLDERREGIRSYKALSSYESENLGFNNQEYKNTFYLAGWNILGVFMNDTPPKITTVAPDVAPFAFTRTQGTFTGTPGKEGTKPFLVCRTTVRSITNPSDTGDGTVQDNTVLTGGQTASCFVGVAGYYFIDHTAKAWMETPASDTFKKKFDIAVAGIRTDEKTIAEIGLPSEDKAAAFRDGISTTEMAALTANNPSAFKKFSVTIVKDSNFQYIPTYMAIDNIDDTVARLNGDTIELKASGFPTVAAGTDMENTSLAELFTAPAGSLKRAFDITIKDDAGTRATGGLVMVAPDFYTNVRSFTLLELDTSISSLTSFYTRALQRGMFPLSPLAADAANDKVGKAGWNIYGVFMDSLFRDYSFTATTGAQATQPIFFCRTTVSTITNGADSGAGTAQDSTALTGGEKASCYVGSVGKPFTGAAADGWLKTKATSGQAFVKKFGFTTAGLRTDEKPLSEILKDGAAALRDGLSHEEIEEITASNSYAYKDFSLTLVKDDAFSYTEPKITFTNFDETTAKLVEGTGGALDTIKIKATQFPPHPATSSTGNIGDVYSISESRIEGSLKRIFDITITGGAAGTASGGLIMVGQGNIASVSDFVDPTAGTNDNGSGALRKEGYSSGVAQATASTNGIFPAGWVHRSVFMNENIPSSADADSSPFAFTAFGETQPFIFCIATISSITSHQPMFNGGIKATTTLDGGQTASCYIGSKGSNLSATWLAKASSNTFKKTFNIAVGGFRTDDKTVSQFMPGATDTDKIQALNDGLNAEELRAIAASSSSAYKKVSLTIVSDDDF